MTPFVQAHAADADWQAALRRAAAQIDRQLRERPAGDAPTLGFLYFTDAYVAHAPALLAAAQAHWPRVAWVGASGVGIAATGIEYFGEPALCLMLAALPRESFRVFSGAQPLSGAGGFEPHAALVHADPATPDLEELVVEMSRRTRSGYLFGGLASAHAGSALHIANGLYEGGLSGVAFAPQLNLVSRVTQGCQPVGPPRRITAAEGNVVLALDEAPALDVLVADTGVNLARPQQTLSRLRETMVGLNEGDEDTLSLAGSFGVDTRVRHLVGLDPGRHAIAIGDNVRAGMQLAFCSRNPEAARRDLVRICSEIREELEPETEALAAGAPAAEAPRIAGALYISCAGRGGPHFGAPSAELQIVRRALGDVPLVGFFAGGEIARHHLYGYTGVLTVFAAD